MIAALIVTYNPSHRLIRNLESLSCQVDRVLIVDNASGKESNSIFVALEAFKKVSFIKNQENLGLSKALNLGVQSLESDFEWLFTFDQDTIVERDYVNRMIEVFKSAEQLFPKVGQVSPRYREENTNFSIDFGTGNAEFSPVTVSLTSGSLFKLSNFRETGLFIEYFFIDYIDYEYCMRLNRMDFKVIEARKIYVSHEIGNSSSKYFLGRYYNTANYNPSRRYFRNRNRILTYKIHGPHFKVWAIKDFYGLFEEIASILLFEQDRWRKIRSVFKGLFDGLTLPVSRIR